MTTRPTGGTSTVSHTEEALAVDLHDLEFMTMQTHRIRHRCLVDQKQLDTLSIG
jgi:hypothetical protein